MPVPPGTLADTIAQAIEQGGANAIKDNAALLQSIAEDAAGKVKTDPFAGVGNLSDVISALDSVVNTLLGLADPIKDLENIAGNAGKSIGIGYVLGYLGWQLGQPFFATLVQDAYKIAVDLGIETQLDAATTAKLVVDGILTQSEGFAEGQRQGYDNGRMGHLFEDAKTRPDVAVLLEMIRRDLIQTPDLEIALQRHGFDSFWQQAIAGLTRQLLSPADLALANLRGNMDDAALQAYARQLGVDPGDMQVLIDNTGEPPGPEQLMEALRRGFIDKARFDRGIRQSRVRNEWEDVEYALRESPMTTADAVRAVVEGHLTDAEGQEIAVENGLMSRDWPTLVASWGRPLSHEQMMMLYFRGQATLPEVQQAFRESDIKNKYIDQAIELGRRLIPERTIVSALDHGVIDHAGALQRLKELGFNDADAQALVALGTAQRATSHKTLSRTDILAMYSDTLITRQVALDHIEKLGYDTADATAMLDLADYKRKASALKTLERGVEATLKAHHITQQQAITQLQAGGLDAQQATTLVDEWLAQRATVTRTLTEAQVLKAVGEKILTEADGRARLMATGLADADVTILYQLHGILPIPG